jgi:YD repeat-containing protein
VTIRAKLYAAIVLTILGPLATTAVALHGMSEMGDSFDEVHERAQDEALARELKFGVTDMNGWQTAYGYDGTGRFRPQFDRSADKLRQDLATGREALSEPQEQALLSELEGEFDRFIALDKIAFRALRDGDDARVKQIFLGPELVRFEAMAATAERLAAYEAERATEADEAFDQDRDDARRRLIAVALGAGMVIILLLVTAQDVARMALEGERSARGRASHEGKSDEP